MRLSLVTLIAAAFTSTLALAASTDQLAATKHNFTVAGTYSALGTDSTICQPCHTPHHAIVDSTVSTRLWNHKLSEATYTLYEGTTAGVTTAEDSQGMDRVSRLCLGCHDGTVALDAFGKLANNYDRNVGTLNFVANDASNLGIDFRDDHPVGVDGIATDTTGTAVGYLKPTTVTYNTAGDPTSGIKSVKIGALSLAKLNNVYVVGCKTCHNPHGAGTVNNTPYPHMLYMSAAGLCNNCHNK